MMSKFTFFYTIVTIHFVLFAGLAESRTIHAEWNLPNIADVAGYRLYHENNQICETNDPSATSIDCEVDIAAGETWFTLTYVLENGVESAHSSPFTCAFSTPLQASISTDISQGVAPLQVAFDASASTGEITNYNWTFGDGATASGAAVNHTFTDAGNYNVTLAVTDDTGTVDQQNILITVSAPPAVNNSPSAVISSSTAVGEAPLLVVLDASGSTDSDGTITSYHWDLGDGESATGQQVSHTYTIAGTYNPTLTVTDDDGKSDSASTPVLVQPSTNTNIAPTAVISSQSTTGDAPLTITLSGSDSTDQDGSISKYSWDFGDGSIGSGEIVTHTFEQPATYTVSLTVVDNSGAASQAATIQINVAEPGENPETGGANLLPILNLLLLDE